MLEAHAAAKIRGMTMSGPFLTYLCAWTPDSWQAAGVKSWKLVGDDLISVGHGVLAVAGRA